MTAIELSGVSAGYDGVPAIGDLDLRVDAGEVVALVGPNGAGKTTTVRAIAGLTPALLGSVRILDRDVTTDSPRVRARIGLGTVTDGRGVFTQLTVYENVRLGGRPRQPTPALEDWFPDLVPMLDRRAGLLSGGEQTLFALARALARRPGALIVDELTTGLAPAFVETASDCLRRAASAWGTGVLLADQAADHAIRMADRVVVLRRGAVVYEGTPSDLRRQPGLLEATYLGTHG